MDGWDTPLPWHQEKLLTLCLATDASNYRYGAQLQDDIIGDF